MKTGHCLSEQHTSGRRTAPLLSAGGAGVRRRRGTTFKVCPEWKAQQKVLWAEVRKESGRRKYRFTIRDLLVDGRCSRSVLVFLSTMEVGGLGPAEEDAGCEVSEWELREWEKERRVEAEELGAGEGTAVPPGALLVCGRGVGGGAGYVFLCSFFVRVIFLCGSIDARHIFLGQA